MSADPKLVEPRRLPLVVSRAIDDRCSHERCRTKGSYTLPATCFNCGWAGEVTQTRGHRRTYPNHRCPYCGCEDVTTGKLVVSESTADPLAAILNARPPEHAGPITGGLLT